MSCSPVFSHISGFRGKFPQSRPDFFFRLAPENSSVIVGLQNSQSRSPENDPFVSVLRQISVVRPALTDVFPQGRSYRDVRNTVLSKVSKGNRHFTNSCRPENPAVHTLSGDIHTFLNAAPTEKLHRARFRGARRPISSTPPFCCRSSCEISRNFPNFPKMARKPKKPPPHSPFYRPYPLIRPSHGLLAVA